VFCQCAPVFPLFPAHLAKSHSFLGSCCMSSIYLFVYLFIYLFYFVVLGFELMSTPWTNLPALFCGGFFRERVSLTICLGLASNSYPPDLCLLSNWDYRPELPVPGMCPLFKRNFCDHFPITTTHFTSLVYPHTFRPYSIRACNALHWDCFPACQHRSWMSSLVFPPWTHCRMHREHTSSKE
jgi:hypothetical protein